MAPARLLSTLQLACFAQEGSTAPKGFHNVRTWKPPFLPPTLTGRALRLGQPRNRNRKHKPRRRERALVFQRTHAPSRPTLPCAPRVGPGLPFSPGTPVTSIRPCVSSAPCRPE